MSRGLGDVYKRQDLLYTEDFPQRFIGISLNAPIFVSKTNIRRNRIFSYTCLLHLTNNYIPMKYLEFTFHTTPCTEIVNDVLSAVLGEAGFESFVEQTDGIAAYIQKDLYNETVLKEALADFPLPDTQVEYAYQEAEDKDWNEEWEKNFFQPIIIGDRCVIHSTFHRDIPQAEYDIVINPQMAFGTGHHETTSLIIGELLDNDLQGKSLLDMGCGTSILAILARMRGAAPCTAVDIDEWCVRNSLENIELNGVDRISVFQGDASLLKDQEPFDVIIANINRCLLYTSPSPRDTR